jgi:hypothetical protein
MTPTTNSEVGIALSNSLIIKGNASQEDSSGQPTASIVCGVTVSYAPLKRRSTIILHGSISQQTTLNIILAAVRT